MRSLQTRRTACIEAPLTKIVISGLHGRRLEGTQYASKSTYNADLYVFACWTTGHQTLIRATFGTGVSG
jgi:hypothetical protein